MGRVYIYGLADPIDGVVRYVGKTTQPAKRLYMHVWLATSGQSDTHRDRWIRRVVATGRAPVMLTLEEVTPATWEERERHWIASLPNLVNTSEGGDGVRAPRTPEWRARIGAAHRGKLVSAETRRRLRESSPWTQAATCSKGHLYTPESTAILKNGGRQCRICSRARQRADRRKRGLKGPVQVCKRGHPLAGDNLRLLERDGFTERICRQCVRERNARAKARARKRGQ
jgi:hypothetical protein